jgi:hypothetical protein
MDYIKISVSLGEKNNYLVNNTEVYRSKELLKGTKIKKKLFK